MTISIDDMLEKIGLKYEDLNQVEKETYNSWYEALVSNQLTLEKLKEYIEAMRLSVEEELVKMDNNQTKDIFLKARLRNYILIEGLLLSPERAQRAIEAQLSNLNKKSWQRICYNFTIRLWIYIPSTA